EQEIRLAGRVVGEAPHQRLELGDELLPLGLGELLSLRVRQVEPEDGRTGALALRRVLRRPERGGGPTRRPHPHTHPSSLPPTPTPPPSLPPPPPPSPSPPSHPAPSARVSRTHGQQARPEVPTREGRSPGQERASADARRGLLGGATVLQRRSLEADLVGPP